MAKVLLISPPFYRLMESPYNGMHLGLAYIASYLNHNGHEAIIYNADHKRDMSYKNQKQIFENFYDYKDALSGNYHPIWDEVKEVIEEANPDFVGVQIYTAAYKSAQVVARLVKEFNKKIKVIVGGVHPTLDPGTVIRNKNYDHLVVGEGEIPMLKIVNGEIKDSIVISKRLNSQELDKLPFPERKSYIEKPNVGYVITARGCPYNCIYCASKSIWGGKVVYRDIENILDEIRGAVTFYAYPYRRKPTIHFQDDTFTLNEDRVIDFCALLFVKRNIGKIYKFNPYDFNWVCDTRVDTINIEMLSWMKAVGCERVKIGVESGSDRILKAMRKGITVEQVRNAVKIIKEVGLKLTIYLMIGFPGETDDDVMQTIKLADEIGADYNSLSICTPYFGTELAGSLRASDDINLAYYFHQSKEMLMNKNISQKVIDRFFKLGEGGEWR